MLSPARQACSSRTVLAAGKPRTAVPRTTCYCTACGSGQQVVKRRTSQVAGRLSLNSRALGRPGATVAHVLAQGCALDLGQLADEASRKTSHNATASSPGRV
jgi:hypothetical protein